MKISVKREQTETITSITVDRSDEIDRTKLGAAIGKSKQYASYLLLGGKLPQGKKGEILIKKIRKVPFRSVSTKRKLPEKRPSEG